MSDDQIRDLFARLAEIDATAIPPVTTERWIPRKTQAALARRLFASLGLKGVSVTTPRYSMASVVEVAVPKLPVEVTAAYQQGRGPYCECPGAMENIAARRIVEEILWHAFPAHRDRSDTMSDYSDAKWSVE